MTIQGNDLVYAFAPTIPAGTNPTSPYVTDLTIPSLQVDAISWKVPPGPRGFMGWALGVSGAQIIPQGGGSWIVTDNEDNLWTLDEQPTTGAWTFFGYNLGRYNHTVYLRFLCAALTTSSDTDSYDLSAAVNWTCDS